MAEAYININNLCKSFGSVVVLDNFCASFPHGKISSIMAPSGKGKTTLFRILLGLAKKDSGSIDGLLDKKTVAVFQEDRLCENLSATVNITIATGADKDRVATALGEVGLSEFSHRPISQLSGGMKRRVAILRALLSDADVILMDEPFKGLDDDTKENVVHLVKRYTTGKTVIIITHQKEEAEELGSVYDIIL